MTRRGTEAEQERARLVEATIAIAGIRGFADTTIEMVVERSGADPAVFDRHFDQLTECFLEAWSQLKDGYMDRVMSAYERGENWRERIRAGIRETVSCVAERPGEARLLGIEVLELGEDGRRRLDGLIDELAGLVDAGRLERPEAATLPRSTADGIVGGAYHRLMGVLRRRNPVDLEAISAELVCFTVTPYLGVEAGLAELVRGPS